MQFTTLIPAVSLLAGAAYAQSTFTDDNGIEFLNQFLDTSVGTADAQFGLALPPADEADLAHEYIGRIVVPIPEDGTWFGITHRSSMTGNLILLAWPNEDEVMTDFRFATGYAAPDAYTGNATLGVISSNVNESHFELTFRCQDCFVWDQEGTEGNNIPATKEGARQALGWAQGATGPTNPADQDAAITQHASALMAIFEIEAARNADYLDWAELAAESTGTPAPAPTGTSGGNSTTPAAPTAAACSGSSNNTETYDYIIVGSGAGGIPAAAKLAESGKKVLLIERGPASTGQHGGTMAPDWLAGSGLTRFDVPGLDNQIHVSSEGIACTDYAVMAGCVLGGGTAINAGLWWNPDPLDFDEGFPEGWKHKDISPAIERAFEKIPYNERPSKDGNLYKAQGYNIVGGALAAAGWKNVSAGAEPAEKDQAFTHPNHMFADGERGGPMATYLVEAKELPNFTLMVNTTVNRVIRDGSSATGVETEAFLPGGHCGNINLADGGNVVLSAGAFGSPKILMRSGIGPQEQLETVSKAEGDAMIAEADWINLPVGENLDDHANTEIVITHPNVEFYDFYAAYDDPIPSDETAYLEDRSGILAQSAPNLAVVFWHNVEGPDGNTRSNQWTARVESSHGVKSNKSISLSHYLGRGKTSRGRTTITSGLSMVVDETPYINNDDDLAATKESIKTVIEALTADKQVDLVFPSPNTTLDAYLEDYAVTTGGRTANHWMGSCKMGADSGLEDGTAVVDLDTKVYGMDNLFVVDASIFPNMITTNPSALIVSVAEHAVEKILALGESSMTGSNSTTTAEKVTAASNGTSTAEPSAAPASSLAPLSTGSVPSGNNATAATEDKATSIPFDSEVSDEEEPSPAEETASTDTEPVKIYQQCGGMNWSGSTTCEEGTECHHYSEYYHQCIRPE